MSIFYALIAKNYDLILSEYTDYTGNFQQITRILLYKLKVKEKKINNNIYCLLYDNYIYNFLVKDNLLFLCISFKENNNNSQINSLNENILIYAFLFDLKKFFFTEYNTIQIEKSKSYELMEFDNTIQSLIEYYNQRPNFTKSGVPIYNFINEDKNIIIENINKYFHSDELLNMTVFQNEAYNNQTIAKQNIVLLDYNKRREKIEQFKTIAKILSIIIGFAVILYLFIHFFGNKENINMNNDKKNLKKI